MKRYAGETLEPIDQHLLKGFYVHEDHEKLHEDARKDEIKGMRETNTSFYTRFWKNELTQ